MPASQWSALRSRRRSGGRGNESPGPRQTPLAEIARQWEQGDKIKKDAAEADAEHECHGTDDLPEALPLCGFTSGLPSTIL